MPSRYVPRARKTVEQRFMDKVHKHESGCWHWTGHITTSGYGAILVNGKKTKAHRVSYELFVGPIVDVEGADYRGTCVIHKCDNPLCVNPDHLLLGSHKTNMEDKAQKCRVVSHPRIGDQHQNAKLRSSDIPKIRSLRESGFSFNKIAKQFGVNPVTIFSVIKGATWSHI